MLIWILTTITTYAKNIGINLSAAKYAVWCKMLVCLSTVNIRICSNLCSVGKEKAFEYKYPLVKRKYLSVSEIQNTEKYRHLVFCTNWVNSWTFLTN